MDLLTLNDQPGEYPSSCYYVAASDLAPAFAVAAGDIRCDVCVIGGGYMGLSSALHLAERGFDVVLLEANRVGWGASGRNGGQVNIGQRIDQIAIERLVGFEQAKQLWDLAEESVALVKELIDRHHIQCDFRDGVIQADLRPAEAEWSRLYAEKLERDYGCKTVRALDRQAISGEIGAPIYAGGLRFEKGGHLQPLDYALGLARAAKQANARIFERSRVLKIEPGKIVTISTGEARVTADYLVLGWNGYHGDMRPLPACYVMPINNFIIATEPLGEAVARRLLPTNAAVYDSNFVVNFYRLSGDHRLLFGGGETYGWTFPEDIAAVSRKRMLAVFPELAPARIGYAWGGTLGITMNRLPHVYREAGNILSAGGFSGHGVALATFSGRVIAEAIAGQAGTFDIMASIPMRPFPGGTMFRWPFLVLAMIWFGLRDRL